MTRAFGYVGAAGLAVWFILRAAKIKSGEPWVDFFDVWGDDTDGAY